MRVDEEATLFLAAASSIASQKTRHHSQNHQQQQQQHQQQPQQRRSAPSEIVVDEASSGADTPSDDLHRLSDLDGLDQSFQAEFVTDLLADRGPVGGEGGGGTRDSWTNDSKKSIRPRSEAEHYSKEELRQIESFLETSVEIDDDGCEDPLEKAFERVLEDGAEAVRLNRISLS